MEWKIIGNGKFIDNSNWIEEEDNLLEWSENLNFIKQPLNYIAITFIYTSNACVSGMLRTNISLDSINYHTSALNETTFFDKVNTAKIPKPLVPNINIKDNHWLEKVYDYEDAAIYNIINDADHVDHINTNTPFVPIVFSHHYTSENTPSRILKISNSIAVFHDLYEIVVIMREVIQPITLKSILRDGSKIGKTKKVHISDDSPKKYVYMKKHPVSGKRKTRRNPI